MIKQIKISGKRQGEIVREWCIQISGRYPVRSDRLCQIRRSSLEGEIVRVYISVFTRSLDYQWHIR
jgi:hypothetical protein